MGEKVTIVIPAYNAARCLRETMETVFNQTYRNLEIICINDASTDGTEALLQELSQIDSRLIYKTITHKGCGAANARNTGLEMATGEYVIFLDADDLFDEDLIVKLLEQSKRFDADITYCDAYIYMEDTGEIISPDYLLRKQNLPMECFSWRDASEHLFDFGSLSAWTQLYKREFLQKNDIQFQSYNYCDDISFVQKAVCCADRITWISDRLIKWRKSHAESQTTNRDKYPLVLMQCFRDIKNTMKDYPGFIAARASWDRRALETLAFYFMTLSSVEPAEVFYDAFMGEFRREFGFDEHVLNYYDDIRIRTWLDRILTYSKKDFIKMQNYNSLPIDKLTKSDRVVLYGAGKCGRGFFCQNLAQRKYHIVAWADKNADAMGFPICKPEALLDMEYDYVLIAAAKEELRLSIKQSLVAMGLDEEKIIV